MGFSNEQIKKNKDILNKMLVLMENEGITVNQAETISKMLSYEFEKNRKLLGDTQKFSVFKD